MNLSFELYNISNILSLYTNASFQMKFDVVKDVLKIVESAYACLLYTSDAADE